MLDFPQFTKDTFPGVTHMDLFSGLFGDVTDDSMFTQLQRSTRIMLAGGFKGTFALEYEAGPLNGIEGAKYLFKEVMAALSSPVPVI